MAMLTVVVSYSKTRVSRIPFPVWLLATRKMCLRLGRWKGSTSAVFGRLCRAPDTPGAAAVGLRVGVGNCTYTHKSVFYFPGNVGFRSKNP